MPQHPSDLSRPPNPPREVSRRYVISLFTTSAGFVVGLVFSLIGCIFTGVGTPILLAGLGGFDIGAVIFALVGVVLLVIGAVILFMRYKKVRRISRVIQSGYSKLGEVVSAGYNTSVTINNRHPYQIRYTFRPLGGEVAGTYQTLDHRAGEIETGSPVYVLYDPEEPKYNTLYPHWEEI